MSMLLLEHLLISSVEITTLIGVIVMKLVLLLIEMFAAIYFNYWIFDELNHENKEASYILFGILGLPIFVFSVILLPMMLFSEDEVLSGLILISSALQF